MTRSERPTAIALGFEVGAGTPVAIPLKHLAITGQTQEAGKTTALEALITRSGLRALTFVTKRGEGAFTTGRPTEPYFREQADWRFVSSMLEAFLGERMKFERSWIMRATKGARTLADVRRNIVRLAEKAKGLNADVFMVLGEYLDELVPAIAAVTWAPRVELAAGVNVMDLASVPSSMQHLVIKSSIDWVLEHEEQTVVVVPEAWKFIPQGRGTPVKLSAMAYIRQGAALGNYLWLDSQDIGGVDKELLRSVPVWILGVQREANEIKRTLSNIPATVAKPKAADIALLELGQFYACWGKHAIKTYVQPTWIPDDLARQVAMGVLDVRNASAIAGGANVMKAARAVFGSVKEESVTKDEAARLTRENDELKANNKILRERLEALEKGQHEQHPSRPDRETRSSSRAATPQPRPAAGADAGSGASRGGAEQAPSNGHVDEALYQAIKARLMADAPAFIRVLTTLPELEVQVTRKTLTLDEYSGKGRIARLLKDGFFREPKSPSQVRAALKRTGPDMNTANIGRALDDFTRDGFTTDEGSGYREVPNMIVNVLEG